MSKKSNLKKALVISFGLHALLIVALLWGADFTMSKPEPQGNMVQAVVIDPSLVQKQAQQIREKRQATAKAEQDRLDKLRRESERLEKNRKAEEERIRKLKEQQAKEAKAAREAEKKRIAREKEQKAQQEKLRVEKERAAKAEADRKAKEAAAAKAEQARKERELAAKRAEEQRIAEEKAAKEAAEKARLEKERAEQAERERIAKEKAAAEAAEKARQEKERLEQLERERKEQEAALNDIFAGLETEASANSSAAQQAVTSEVSRYGEIYKQMIQNNLLVEDSFAGKSCRVNLKLIPAGSSAVVGNLSILGGDSRLCSATKRAVAQTNTFPLPSDPAVVSKLKNINLTVEL
ncbi:cell envelope integrity protein TolA [Vibrio maerlii]|uniref:cell envelope integrity protein TolA n=1 Tax=Vibrio maerlii TaxID=2231648 RepID=UPI000E3EDDC9|nr:cell envelope integrity protein TolA [Vibrio maerlii]